MLKAVYDVDDTLWDLTTPAYERAGLKKSDAIVFMVNDNPVLTDEQKEAIVNAFRDPEVFEHCVFDDAAYRIFDIDKSGEAHVWISSANLSSEVRDVKRRRLITEIPNANGDQMTLTVKGDAYQGREPGDILVDDSLINMQESNFDYYILIDMPHNNSPESMDLHNTLVERGRYIVRVKTLKDAVDIVERIVRTENGVRGMWYYGEYIHMCERLELVDAMSFTDKDEYMQAVAELRSEGVRCTCYSDDLNRQYEIRFNRNGKTGMDCNVYRR